MIPYIVNSCRAFADTWRPHAELLKRFWSDCPYEKVLVTDYDSPKDSRDDWRVIALGYDWNWCRNLRFALEQLGTPEIVMLTQDDFWLRDEVSYDHIALAEGFVTNFVDASRIGCLRLACNPPADNPAPLPVYPFGIHSKKRMYRTSAAPAFWKTSYLLKILEHTNNVMEFYLQGPAFSDQLPELVLAQFEPNNAIPFVDSAVVRGKWDKNIVEWVRSLGVEVDTSRREMA